MQQFQLFVRLLSTTHILHYIVRPTFGFCSSACFSDIEKDLVGLC